MIAPPPLPAPPPPLRPRFASAFGGIWRLTYRRFTGAGQLVALAGLLAAFLLLTYTVVPPGRAEQFAEWVIGFYLLTIVPIIAFVSGGGTIRDDMKAGTVDYLLTRPVRRATFLGARYVSHLVCVQVIHVVVLLALVGVGSARGLPNLAATFSHLFVAQLGTITAFLALGYVCGAATSRYLVLGITYAGVVEMGLGNIPIQLSKLSVLRHVRAYLMDQFPGVVDGPVAPQSAVMMTAMVLIFVAVWLAAAALAYSLQEFAGQRPKDA